MSKRYPIYHNDECGEIGMLTTIIDPQVGEPLIASKFFHVNGKPFNACDGIICDSCGKRMLIRIEWIDYEDPRDA